VAIEAVRVFTVICDSCGRRHHNPDNRMAIEARVSAGIAGWGFRQGIPNAKNQPLRQPLDWCPDCTLERASERTSGGN
jgi:hypothetical protein